jgi:peptidoglycan-N-acetylglucosamine deacetylase
MHIRSCVAAMLLAGMTPIPLASAADYCWSPGELRNVEGSERIQRNVSSAFVALPRSASSPPPATFRPVKGAIRRVALPPGAPKLVALTFDLCEQPDEIAGYQGELVDYLRSKSIRATFFAGGKWMLTHARRAQQLMSDPLFEVANHAWEHRNVRTISGAKLDDEIRGAQAAYEMVRGRLVERQCLNRDAKAPETAVPPRMSLFRYPFGACDDSGKEAVSRNGLLAVQWDISSSDPDKSLSAPAMADLVVKRVRPGSIVLFHANGRGWNTPKAVPEIVARLEGANFKFATVGDLLAYPGAQWEVSKECYDERPGDTNRYDGLSRTLNARYEKFLARFAGDNKRP